MIPEANQPHLNVLIKKLRIPLLLIIGTGVVLALFLGMRGDANLPVGGNESSISHSERREGINRQVFPNSRESKREFQLSSIYENASKENLERAREYLAGISYTDPDLLVEMLGNEDLFEDPEWFDYASGLLAIANPTALHDLAGKLTSLELQSRFYEAGMRELCLNQRWDSALEILESSHPSGRAGQMWGIYSKHLASVDFQKAIEVLSTIDFAEGRAAVEGALLNELRTRQEAPDLADLEKTLMVSGLSSQGASEVAAHWINSVMSVGDAAETLDRIRVSDLPDDQKRRLVVELATLEIERDPTAETVSSWLRNGNADKVSPDIATRGVGILAKKDLNQAKAVVKNLTSENSVEPAMITLMAVWLKHDTWGAADWISQFRHETPQFKYGGAQIVRYLDRVGATQEANKWRELIDNGNKK